MLHTHADNLIHQRLLLCKCSKQHAINPIYQRLLLYNAVCKFWIFNTNHRWNPQSGPYVTMTANVNDIFRIFSRQVSTLYETQIWLKQSLYSNIPLTWGRVQYTKAHTARPVLWSESSLGLELEMTEQWPIRTTCRRIRDRCYDRCYDRSRDRSYDRRYDRLDTRTSTSPSDILEPCPSRY